MIDEMGQARPIARSYLDDTNSSWLLLRDRLRRAALALTRSHADAEDLTQQTLAHVLAQSPEHLGHLGYVRRTMLHLWLSEQRSLRRRLRRLAGLALIVAPWKEGKDQPTGAEEHDSVHRAIDALPPQQRAAIVLRVIEGLDYAEIAATLGCPVGAVRANLHLARKKVRQMLGEEQ